MEEQFYLVWPAFEKFGGRTARVLFLGGLLGICQASNFGLADQMIDQCYGISDAHLLPIFLCTFTPIIFGVLLAHLLHHRRSFDLIARLCQPRWTIPTLIAGLFLAAQLAGATIQGAPRLAIHLIMMALLASLLLQRQGIAVRLLQVPPLAYLGRISYGVYLYHTVVLTLLLGGFDVLHIRRPPPFIVFTAVLGITAGIATLSFRYIESPLLRLRPWGAASTRLASAAI
jgi:peptidoglycan/LPS O-acetylase OafA/YrhL